MVTGWKTATVKETSTIFGRIGFRGYTKEDIVDAYEGAISLSPSNLKDGKVDITNSTFISWDKYNESPEIKLQDGDVVLVKTGSTYGKSAYVDNLKWATTLNPQIVVFKNVKINKKLFAYFVQTPEFQKQIEATIVGGAIPTLSQNQVYQFEITFPIDVGEQQRIAEALSDVDRMISSLEKLIAKKKAIKQGAVQELLTGKNRLSGFTGEWKDYTIGKMGEFYSGLSGKSKKDFDCGKAHYITFLNVLSNVKIDTSILASVDVGENESQNSVRKGDLFFNTSSETPEEVGMCAVLDEELENTYLNSFCFGFRLFDDTHDPIFLSYYLNSAIGRKIMSVLAQGATRYNLSKNNFAETIIKLPTKEEQTAIASILSDMDNEIETLEQKLEKTHQIKQGMMQQLLTGKIRLV